MDEQSFLIEPVGLRSFSWKSLLIIIVDKLSIFSHVIGPHPPLVDFLISQEEHSDHSVDDHQDENCAESIAKVLEGWVTHIAIVCEPEYHKGQDSSHNEEDVLDNSHEQVESWLEDVKKERNSSMDEIVEDEQDRSYYRVIDEKGNEYSVGEQPASPDPNVEIRFGLVAKTDGFEVHEIVV